MFQLPSRLLAESGILITGSLALYWKYIIHLEFDHLALPGGLT